MSAFSGARHQNRIRIVYVSINLPARWRLMQEFEAAVANGQMIHLTRSASAGPNSDQFAVTPERTIKENDIGLVDCTP